MSNPLAEAAQSHVNGLVALQTELADLKASHALMRSDNARLLTLVERLDHDIERERAERDHYQQFSTSLVTRLSAISMLIEEVMREAREDTLRNPTPPQSSVSPALEETLTSHIEAQKEPNNG